MIKEIIVAKAYIADQCTNMRKFEAAATRLNANPCCGLPVNGHSILKRFKARMEAVSQMCNVDEWHRA